VRALLAVVALGAVLAMTVALVGIIALPLADSLRIGGSAQPSPAGSVAGIASTPVPAPAVIVDETFDGLSINSSLPPSWDVTGSGAAVVIALPTSVDRSVRLRASDGGNAERACHPLPPGATVDLRIELDFVLETALSSDTNLVTLASGANDAVTIGLDRNGRLLGADATSGSLPAGTWAHLSLTMHRASPTVDWEVTAAGTSLGAARNRAPDNAFSGISALCLQSPQSTQAGSVAFNNVRATG
jgi:hypothetical protein